MSQKRNGFILLAAMGAALLIFASTAGAQERADVGRPEYLDPALPLNQRVDDLVSRMTIEEKCSQLVHQAAAIPRLRVPAYNWWSEALHGVLTDKVTVFPEPIGLAATFDSPLIREIGTVIGTEARAIHHEQVRHGNFVSIGLDFWAPNLNIFRDPRWGRGQETYGEDPYLSGRMGVAYVTGMQGDDPKYLRVIATPKHYAVHSGPEPLRHGFDAKVSKHDMEDTYLPAFRAEVTEDHAGSVMCVYNSVNGEPGCANTFLLRDQLREKWGFQGYVVSDCDAVYDIYRGHHFTKTLEEAAAISLRRGTDLDCNDPSNDYSRYLNAVKQGLLTEQDVDVAVKRLFRARFALGMFDPPEMVPYARTPLSEADSEAHRQLAARAARESMVLLTNDGTLPLQQGVKKIAVVGPLGDNAQVLSGNYNGTTSHVTTALEGVRKQFPGAQVTFAAGTNFLRNSATVIPGELLFTNDGKPGLQGEYFQGTNLEGKPIVVRIDKDVNFDFGGTNPAPGLTAINFSVRWSGVLKPKKSGPFQIGFTGDDGFRLWIDGKLIVEDWTMHAPSTLTKEMDLKAGKSYAIKIEYFQAGGGAVARLVWSAKEPPESQATQKALQIAREADVVIAVVGITSSLEGEEMNVNVPGFKGGDRTSIDLPKPEEDLLKAVKATKKPLVVVLMNGSALAVNWASKNANAILDAWYAGEEGGKAIGETLAGANNPAGRLPVTFYTGVDQVPPFEDYAMQNRTYRYYRGEPLFAFGHGLSYSKFVYRDLKLSAQALKAGESLGVDVTIENIGKREGDEVAQLYLHFPGAPQSPRLNLRGFTRLHLAAGESRQVHFTLVPRDLSDVNPTGDRVIGAGPYRLSVGGGQPQGTTSFVEADFGVEDQQVLPE